MNRYKTFDSTGIATGGRLYAADLNAIQDAAAGLTDFTQTISLGSALIGESGLALSRFGSGEAQITGLFRSTGLFRGMAGIVPGTFTTTQRNAIGAGLAPTGIIIYNSTTAQFEWNAGTDGARNWKALSYDPSSDLILTGGGSSLDFTDQTAANLFLTAKRSADSVPRFTIKEDGVVEWGAGGATAKDVNLYRDAANVLATDDQLYVKSTSGVKFADGSVLPRASVRGKVNADGTIAQGSGFSVSHPGTGRYVITFSTAFATAPVVVASPLSGQIFPRIAVDSSTTSVEINMLNTGNSLTDVAFHFIAEAG